MVFGRWFGSRGVLRRLAGALVGLPLCAGWSGALMVAHTELLEISCTGSFVIS